jgi:hypothetical protein
MQNAYDAGAVIAVCSSRAHDFGKPRQSSILLEEGLGIMAAPSSTARVFGATPRSRTFVRSTCFTPSFSKSSARVGSWRRRVSWART